MMTYPLVTTGLLARTPKSLLSFCWAERYNDAFSKLETWKAFKRGLGMIRCHSQSLEGFRRGLGMMKYHCIGIANQDMSDV